VHSIQEQHKLSAAVLRYRWYPFNNPRKIAAVLFRRFITPAKLKEFVKKQKSKC
jgi:hypothetical protein